MFYHGYLSKSTEEGRRKINELYKNAHFFVLPTQNECYGIVFCEASSFGLPSLAPKTGGVPSVVIDGKNGKLFELSDGGEKYAEYIETMLADYESYKKLCISSFEEYETRLNWKVAGETIIGHIEELLTKRNDKKMNINRVGSNPCSSCGLCVVACSQDAITFSYDENGFYRPTVNDNKCNDCGICCKVCYKYLDEKSPFENVFKNKPIYAAWSKEKSTVLSSSSGGVGYELTSYYDSIGYNVCGVIFDAAGDVCKHIIAKSKKDIEAIKASKYLQSYTIDAFSQLKKDEKYVVVGTPCQIYGLRKWIQLKEWEDNFILVDFFCHGTPGFNLWKKYKKYICEKYELDSKWEFVNFRKKNPESKWHKNAISIRDSSGKKFEKSRAFSEDLFFKFFLNNSCLNEACYKCKLRLDYCASDIRIGDFWGQKYAANDDGVSLVIINTPKGEEIWKEIKDKFTIEKCNYEDLKLSQPIRYFTVYPKRATILKALKDNKPLEKIHDKYFSRSILRKGLSYVMRRIRK